jgi:hypothetical protein
MVFAVESSSSACSIELVEIDFEILYSYFPDCWYLVFYEYVQWRYDGYEEKRFCVLSLLCRFCVCFYLRLGGGGPVLFYANDEWWDDDGFVCVKNNENEVIPLTENIVEYR